MDAWGQASTLGWSSNVPRSLVGEPTLKATKIDYFLFAVNLGPVNPEYGFQKQLSGTLAT